VIKGQVLRQGFHAQAHPCVSLSGMMADVLPAAMILGRVTEARDGAPYKNLKVREIFSKSPALYCVDTVEHVSLCHTTFCTGPFRCGPVVKGVAQAMLKCRALRRSFVFFLPVCVVACGCLW
jgi:hypothetical protein